MLRNAPKFVLLAVALLAGCGHDAGPPAGPGSAAPAPISAGPASDGAALSTVEPSDAEPGTLTCARLGVAIQRASLMDPGVIDAIVAASGTADAPVADAAERLRSAYAAAVAAKGTEKEPDAVAAVSAAAADMNGVCDQSGLQTAG